MESVIKILRDAWYPDQQVEDMEEADPALSFLRMSEWIYTGLSRNCFEALAQGEEEDMEEDPPEEPGMASVDAAPVNAPPELQRATPLENLEDDIPLDHPEDDILPGEGLKAVKIEREVPQMQASNRGAQVFDPSAADTLVMQSPESEKITLSRVYSQDSNPQFGMTPTSPDPPGKPLPATLKKDDDLASMDEQIQRMEPLVSKDNLDCVVNGNRNVSRI